MSHTFDHLPPDFFKILTTGILMLRSPGMGSHENRQRTLVKEFPYIIDYAYKGFRRVTTQHSVRGTTHFNT